MISNPFNGVVIPAGVLGVSWAPHVHAHAAAAAFAVAAPASMRKRRAATATLASVNRGSS
ncbi:hypothetical protein [Mycolicibacterium sediminis]|uniref:Uncharacterized protein n=1 Tax=Mycolicibacterium sediminis TaxID=1286180 RepID=A0A7I7QQX7_9MYCO|nr:hypothetical protein [Mycolicibacterium sediminis]BBY28724.1 hypothetical protein MSEDJ_28200 [Mycolicibacterium sediminis]